MQLVYDWQFFSNNSSPVKWVLNWKVILDNNFYDITSLSPQNSNLS